MSLQGEDAKEEGKKPESVGEVYTGLKYSQVNTKI